ncbi:MAG: ABC transporter ATP-binding protein [Candidatus Brocadiaceae bacterium]|nr:ABC transporter ATP-binding protein [Candidatus Brocadiaceae bacterium]
MVFEGPSGSGKTTLLNIIGTLDKPTTGKIYLYDNEVSSFSDIALSRLRREHIGFIFQDFNLIPRLSSWENVSYPLIPLGITSKIRFKRALSLLEKLGLGDRLNHTPEELSGGQQQRVALARALINNPKLIIADEPTSNIDEDTGKQLLEFFLELKTRETTILVATHDKRFENVADQIFHMNNGKVV